MEQLRYPPKNIIGSDCCVIITYRPRVQSIQLALSFSCLLDISLFSVLSASDLFAWRTPDISVAFAASSTATNWKKCTVEELFDITTSSLFFRKALDHFLGESWSVSHRSGPRCLMIVGWLSTILFECAIICIYYCNSEVRHVSFLEVGDDHRARRQALSQRSSSSIGSTTGTPRTALKTSQTWRLRNPIAIV